MVFAAGNCGDASATDDLIDSCDVLDTNSGTVLSPAQAKNVVAVGSSESGGSTGKDIDTVSYFSSKGYTIDGRIKPDVVAPGDPIYSSYADPTGESCDFGYQTVRYNPRAGMFEGARSPVPTARSSSFRVLFAHALDRYILSLMSPRK